MFIIDDLLLMALAAAPQALGAGATAAGTAATAAGATGLGGMLGSAGAGLTGMGSSIAGAAGGLGSGLGGAMGLGNLGGLLGGASGGSSSASLLSKLPTSMIESMQGNGLLGSVVDATGGLETAATAANNVGGGLLGTIANPKLISPGFSKGMGAMGMEMMKNSMSPQQQMQQAPAPGPMYSGQQQNLAPLRSREEEMRRRRLAYLTRTY